MLTVQADCGTVPTDRFNAVCTTYHAQKGTLLGRWMFTLSLSEDNCTLPAEPARSQVGSTRQTLLVLSSEGLLFFDIPEGRLRDNTCQPLSCANVDLPILVS